LRQQKNLKSLAIFLNIDESNFEEKLKLVDDFVPIQRTPNVEAVGKLIAELLSANLEKSFRRD